MGDQVQTLEEIRAHYPDEYLLVVVTEEKQGLPVKGILRAHGKDRKRMLNKMASCATQPVYFFYNGLPASSKTAYVL